MPSAGRLLPAGLVSHDQLREHELPRHPRPPPALGRDRHPRRCRVPRGAALHRRLPQLPRPARLRSHRPLRRLGCAPRDPAVPITTEGRRATTSSSGLPLIVLVCGWGASLGAGRLRWSSAVAHPSWAPRLAFQVIICVRCLLLDVDQPFSDSKAAAALLPGRRAPRGGGRSPGRRGTCFWKPHIVMRGGGPGRACPSGTSRATRRGTRRRRRHADGPRGVQGRAGPHVLLGRLVRNLGALRARTPCSAPREHPLGADPPPTELFDLSQVDCKCLCLAGM